MQSVIGNGTKKNIGTGCKASVDKKQYEEVLRQRGENLRRNLIRVGTIQPESRKEEMMAADW